jgi:hypothetical protein
MILGGVTLSALGGGSTFFIEKRPPTPKGLMRDFMIGAVMVAFIMQLLPESASSFIQGLIAMVPVSISSIQIPKMGSDDMEVRVGVPTF